jgi:hypothetical protein
MVLSAPSNGGGMLEMGFKSLGADGLDVSDIGSCFPTFRRKGFRDKGIVSGARTADFAAASLSCIFCRFSLNCSM